MCRMMAVLSRDSIKANWLLAFEPLAIKGEIRSDMEEPGHHDGWGMVTYFRKGWPEYIGREPHSVTKDSEIFRNGAKILEQSQCKIALTHFRKISVGDPKISNTHPFIYQQWSFTHNGTIYNSEQIPLKKIKPTGTTDSERFFLFLLEYLTDTPENKKTELEKLREAVEEIKKKFEHTSLTFLLTNGEQLYAYRECDPNHDDYYTLYTTQIEQSRIFVSEPLLELSDQWEPVPKERIVSGI